jgi:hypothetical protein
MVGLKANGVPGVFAVNNNLQVQKNARPKDRAHAVTHPETLGTALIKEDVTLW